MPKIDPRRFPWTALDVSVAAGLAVGAYCAILWLQLPAPGDSALRALSRVGILAAAFTLPAVVILRLRGASALRLWMPPRDLGRDIAAGLVLMLLMATLNGMHILYAVRDLGAGPKGPLEGVVWESAGLWNVGLLLLGIGVVVPVAEEIFFRGVLYTAMRKRLPAAPSILISSAVFGIWHFEHLHLQLHAFLVGVIAAIFVEYTGSLVPAALAHMGVNITFVLFLANRGVLRELAPFWALLCAFVILNVLLFLLGKPLFSPEETAAPRAPSDDEGDEPGGEGLSDEPPDPSEQGR